MSEPSQPSPEFVAAAPFIGVSMCCIAVVCFLPNCYIILATLRTPWMRSLASYRLLLTLCILNIPQTTIYFILGYVTICPTTFIFSEWCGMLSCGCYVSYCTFTVILALNRLTYWVSPYFGSHLFSKMAFLLWCIVGLAPGIILFGLLSSPNAAVEYVFHDYHWHYNYSLRDSAFVRRVEMSVEMTTTILSVLIYIIFLVKLAQTRAIASSNPANNTHNEHRMNPKTLVQTVGISVLCFVLNISWHLITKRSRIFNVFLTYVWLLNTVVTPMVTIWANSAYRQGLRKCAPWQGRPTVVESSVRDLFGTQKFHGSPLRSVQRISVPTAATSTIH